jgi:uncharacterized protein (TIGR00369 family)
MSDSANLAQMLGFENLVVTADATTLTWVIGPEHLQPFGIPHGGVYCAAHETAASWAAYGWLGDRGVPVGANNSTDFLRQAKVGDTITTTARPIHRGRTQQLWRVESVDQDGQLIAQGQVRLANIEPR